MFGHLPSFAAPPYSSVNGPEASSTKSSPSTPRSRTAPRVPLWRPFPSLHISTLKGPIRVFVMQVLQFSTPRDAPHTPRVRMWVRSLGFPIDAEITKVPPWLFRSRDKASDNFPKRFAHDFDRKRTRNLKNDPFAPVHFPVDDRVLHGDHRDLSLLQLLVFESATQPLRVLRTSRKRHMEKGDGLGAVGLNWHGGAFTRKRPRRDSFAKCPVPDFPGFFARRMGSRDACNRLEVRRVAPSRKGRPAYPSRGLQTVAAAGGADHHWNVGAFTPHRRPPASAEPPATGTTAALHSSSDPPVSGPARLGLGRF
jgi:hypothetical protein